MYILQDEEFLKAIGVSETQSFCHGMPQILSFLYKLLSQNKISQYSIASDDRDVVVDLVLKQGDSDPRLMKVCFIERLPGLKSWAEQKLPVC